MHFISRLSVLAAAMTLSACAAAAPQLPAATPSPSEALTPTQTPPPTPIILPAGTPGTVLPPSATSLAARTVAPTVRQTVARTATPVPTTRVTARATLAPTLTRAPQTGTTAPGVRVYKGQTTLSVYPFETYLSWANDATTGVRYATLDRGAYDGSNPSPVSQTFEVVYLENRLVRLAFLPRWGGRLWQATYLPTGQDLFYNNRVVKPSHWGPHASDRNWWLALGGMEWAYPVQEHGFEWGVAWSYRTETTPVEAKITLSDSVDPARVQAQVSVSLRQDEAGWTITASGTNPTARTVPVQFWLNAMLTLGVRSISPDTEFSLPASTVRVHSTGDSRLPGERQLMAWPVHNGVDYSRYRNWQNWIGMFSENAGASTVTVSNTAARLALTRTYSPGDAPGVKLFAFGPLFADRSYTDDNSQYFELWGGPNRSFWPDNDIALAPGAQMRWTERWQVDTR